MNQNKKIPDRAMAILPLRGLNIFPGMLLSFDVERRYRSRPSILRRTPIRRYSLLRRRI